MTNNVEECIHEHDGGGGVKNAPKKHDIINFMDDPHTVIQVCLVLGYLNYSFH